MDALYNLLQVLMSGGKSHCLHQIRKVGGREKGHIKTGDKSGGSEINPTSVPRDKDQALLDKTRLKS